MHSKSIENPMFLQHNADIGKLSTSPLAYARAGAFRKEKGKSSSIGKSLRTRARAREDFYAPSIQSETDAAVDYALKVTANNQAYRRAWCFYCLRLGINTFLDQLDIVMSSFRQGEIRFPAQAFHARLRRLKTQLDGMKGGAK